MAMKWLPLDYQVWTAAHGYNPGPVDGLWGPRTEAAVADMAHDRGVPPGEAIFPDHGLIRIHWHWTAGADGVIDMEADSYNLLIGDTGEAVQGTFHYTAQATYAPGYAASHTLNCNSHAIGMAVDAMAGAVERPFDPGSNPINDAQVAGLVRETAALCADLGVPVTRFTTLSHSEVQPTLGVTQKWKWDLNWLPGMTAPGDPIEVGDRLRASVRSML